MITLYTVRDKNTGEMGEELPGSLSHVRAKKGTAKADITRYLNNQKRWGYGPKFDLEVVELKCYAADEAVPVETTSLERVKVEVKGTEDELLRCRKCGKAVVWEYPFCPECGRKVAAVAE